MGFINKCNNPLNPKFQILFATFIWKSNMKTLSTPFSGAKYLKTRIFRHLIQYLFNIYIFTLKILRQEKKLGHQTYVPPRILSDKFNLLKDVVYIFSTTGIYSRN